MPEIKGPLKEYQYNNRVEVYILYRVDLGREVPGFIQIRHSNYLIFPPDPKLNPQYEFVEISGKRMIKRSGNFARGPGVIYYFSLDNTHSRVELNNFTADEALKVVESMLK